MRGVLIIPTGIGCSIGGHAGDANPVAKLIASCCDELIVHPNVVNASDINEMPENCLYVEGSILDRFLQGEFYLRKPKSFNKILLAVNKPIRPETINAVNAARHTIGCEIEIMELDTELVMEAKICKRGAGGNVFGVEELIEQISKYKFDALAVATAVNVPKQIILDYFEKGGINPWGGVEAIASKLIAKQLDKPVAHSPIESEDSELRYFNKVVNPRMAAEMISQCFLHCVFKGLHRAPRIDYNYHVGSIYNTDIDFLLSPLNCFNDPHYACVDRKIPIIAVKENTTCFTSVKMPSPKKFEYIVVENYLEAAGVILAMKAGVSLNSIREGE
ncbi:MAG: DUF3326 domain-containing protein [Candidatus Hodarchaeales archaeon]|jgi:hypothetical protein